MIAVYGCQDKAWSPPEREYPAKVFEHSRRHLLNMLAPMISGTQLLPGQATERCVCTHDGKGALTVAGTPLAADLADAATAEWGRCIGPAA